MNIIEDENIVVVKQTRFPRSKKKRIKKKWAGNNRNFTAYPDMNYYFDKQRNVVYAHPVAARILKNNWMSE